ncbi:MAG: T9SS type A sorting domain-containing protein [Bacteroidetes bacterium]|nr:T9SS type A sorting domain-containing protein [Bacteroidota bacterium]
MKKLLLLIYLTGIVSFIGYSQIYLSLSDSAGSVVNNAERTFHGTPASSDMSSYIFVSNGSDNAMNVKAKRVRISLIDSSDSFCWGLCYDSTTDESNLHVVIPPHTKDTLNFSGHYNPHGLVGVSSIRYVFFDEANLTDTVCFVALYNTFPAGIEEQGTGKNTLRVYPNPADKMVNIGYNIGTFSESSLVIRNLLGSTVKTIKLATGDGRVSCDTRELNDGIYFYTLIVNGETKISHKLIIKH